MTTNEKEATGDVAVVDKVDTAAVVQIVSASNERLSQMDKLKRKLNAKKTTTTKSLKRLEAAIASFQEDGKEEALMTLAEKNLLKTEAKEVLESADRVKENRKDLESLSALLQEAINECEPNEIQKGITQEEAMAKVESEVDEYIERIDVILKSHRKMIAEAGSASVIDTSAPVHTPAVTSVPQQQQGDQFRELSLLKLKYLEKEANWIKQAKKISGRRTHGPLWPGALRLELQGLSDGEEGRHIM